MELFVFQTALPHLLFLFIWVIHVTPYPGYEDKKLPGGGYCLLLLKGVLEFLLIQV